MKVGGQRVELPAAALILLPIAVGCGGLRGKADREDLRRELLEMAQVDQEVRRRVLAEASLSPAAVEEMQRIDRKNTTRMREILHRHGWPGRSFVGEDGAQAAWLLVQHADHDRRFQKECLGLIEEAVSKGEALPRHLALLKDRVLVGDGKEQIYGTQFREVNGEWVPYPIEDEANVDRRRAEVGLSTMEEYTKSLRGDFPLSKSKKK